MRSFVAMLLGVVVLAPIAGLSTGRAAEAAKDRDARSGAAAKPTAEKEKADKGEKEQPSAAEETAPTDATSTASPSEGTTAADKETPAAEQAQPPATGQGFREALEEVLNSGAMGYMWTGGIFMWPILILGIAAAGVVIERYRSLKMVTSDTGALRREVLALLQADRVEEALKLCDGQQGPIPAVLATGLRKFLVLKRLNYDPGRIEEQVIKAIDDYGIHIVAALEKHLPVLATVASAAPMLGFLGTVQGMVIAFADIVATMGERNIVEAAASGIMVALLTTVLGLIVGIPAYVAYNYFTAVINEHVLAVEESASEMIEAVTLELALGGGQLANPS
jgi:biopolymer transport protein ExbB